MFPPHFHTHLVCFTLSRRGASCACQGGHSSTLLMVVVLRLYASMQSLELPILRCRNRSAQGRCSSWRALCAAPKHASLFRWDGWLGLVRLGQRSLKVYAYRMSCRAYYSASRALDASFILLFFLMFCWCSWLYAAHPCQIFIFFV